MTRETSVGIIGIGLLGSAIVERLRGANLNVVGFDLNESARRALNELGGEALDTPVDVVHRAKQIIVCLPNSTISREVLQSLEQELQPGDLVIDVTTGHPDEMAALGQKMSALNVGYLDATVGGSSQQTREGESIVMIGGAPEHVEQGSDIIATFSREQFHVGDCGAGARMKLVMNLVLGLNRAVLAEGLSFAERNGFDLEQTLKVLRASPARSVMMDKKGDKMITQNYEPQARLAQHLKDVCLILDVGKQGDMPLPLSEIHRQLLETSRAKGFGDADNSAVFEAYR
ncbi:MAG: 6-phosphogluconate dehydrogenase [Planctomyces sp.]|nr:6-phosphogluconate dehydrogenase [Planctomyces sp.]